MAFDENLAVRIRLALARKKNIDEKKMFGGVGFMLNGNMLVGVPKQVTTLCEPGWDIGGVVAKVGKGWRLIEVWNVSP